MVPLMPQLQLNSAPGRFYSKIRIFTDPALDFTPGGQPAGTRGHPGTRPGTLPNVIIGNETGLILMLH